MKKTATLLKYSHNLVTNTETDSTQTLQYFPLEQSALSPCCDEHTLADTHVYALIVTSLQTHMFTDICLLC